MSDVDKPVNPLVDGASRRRWLTPYLDFSEDFRRHEGFEKYPPEVQALLQRELELMRELMSIYDEMSNLKS